MDDGEDAESGASTATFLSISAASALFARHFLLSLRRRAAMPMAPR